MDQPLLYIMGDSVSVYSTLILWTWMTNGHIDEYTFIIGIKLLDKIV